MKGVQERIAFTQQRTSLITRRVTSAHILNTEETISDPLK